ncbi:unnamed protein product [Ascophyllum nodosum]
MALRDSLSFAVSAFVSRALKFVSETMHFRPLIHSVVTKTFDRGKRRVPPGLPAVGAWDVLSDLVVRINGLNPGMHTLQGTNCYLVGAGPRRILVDTGEGVAGFIELFTEVMGEMGCEGLDAILLTHWHADHVGGVKDIHKALGGQSIPVYKRRRSKTESFEHRDIEDGQIFRTEGATLEAVYTPGHTVDHVAFVLHEERALITGDMILGCGTAIFENYTTYMASLKRVQDMSPKYGGGFTRLYCGHGPVVDSVDEKIKFYIDHREKRDQEIIDAMVAAKNWQISSLQITLRVYGFLSIPILLSAHYNVLHHLSKLCAEGKAKEGWIPCSFQLAK